MVKINLTNQQKKYLMFYTNYQGKISAAAFAHHFACSRANSNKILDRMVKVGVFYKVDAKYHLTALGEQLAHKINEEHHKLATVIGALCGKCKPCSESYANDIISLDNSELTNSFVAKYRFISQLTKQRETVDYQTLKSWLGKGEFTLNYHIFKQTVDKEDNVIASSMANDAFASPAILSIDDEAQIILQTKKITKSHQGFLKNACIHECEYTLDGKRHTMRLKDRRLILPLRAVHTWHYLGQGILVASIWLNHKVSISIASHTKQANYYFVLNLFGIE